MLHAGYASTPEIKNPTRTLVMITVLTLGIGYLWWKHKKSKENEDRTVAVYRPQNRQ